MKSWSDRWRYLTVLHPPRRQKTPFHPGALWLITSLWSLIPYAHLTAILMASQGQHEIPETWSQLAVLGQLFTVEKISLWHSVRLAASADEGGECARDLVACSPLAPTCSHSSQREAAACSQSSPSPAQELRSDCTPRCFLVKSCLEKPHRRPQHKQDIHSWQTAAIEKAEWNQSESC